MQNLHSLVSTAAAHTKADIEQLESKVTAFGNRLEHEAKDAPVEAVAAVRNELQDLMVHLNHAKSRLEMAVFYAQPSTNSTPAKV